MDYRFPEPFPLIIFCFLEFFIKTTLPFFSNSFPNEWIWELPFYEKKGVESTSFYCFFDNYTISLKISIRKHLKFSVTSGLKLNYYKSVACSCNIFVARDFDYFTHKCLKRKSVIRLNVIVKKKCQYFHARIAFISHS